LGGYVISDPAVARNSDGRLQVFVIGSDHALYTISQVAASSSSWSGYGYLGGTITGNTNPAAALNSDGQMQVFVVGPANAILYKFQITPGSGSWTDYVSLGGAVISNPVLATNSDNRLELFVVGSDHALYHNSQLSGSLYDNFEGGKYTLSGGQTSSNGRWLDNFNGLGSAGVQDDGTGTNNVFFETPAVPTSTSQTHSTLVTSTQKWGNLQLDVDVKTVHQLRQNSSPNPWEVAWIFFRQTDTFHYYAFLVKPNGIEFDKKDCNTCTDPVQGQQFLVTASSPTLKIGGWSHWKITAIGNHITISVDGNKVIDYVDQTMSQQLSSGAIAMYTEDANVNYDNVFITPQ
jgi:3-keto-disaccharide hydrolase